MILKSNATIQSIFGVHIHASTECNGLIVFVLHALISVALSLVTFCIVFSFGCLACHSASRVIAQCEQTQRMQAFHLHRKNT